MDNEVKITCCGMPKDCYSYVEWKNFKTGLSVPGKLKPHHVKRWNNTKARTIYDKRRKTSKKC